MQVVPPPVARLLESLIIRVFQSILVKLQVNWEHKRVRHALERMWLRGVSVKEVEVAILKGKKAVQKETGLLQAMFRRYVVVYDETIYRESGIRKVYPVTVKVP